MDEKNAIGERWQVNFNTVLAVMFSAFGIYLFVIIPSQVEQPPRIFGQRMIALDPALFPNIVAGGFVLFGLLYLLKSLTLRESNGLSSLGLSGLLNVGFSVGVMTLYSALIEPVGFVPSSIALMIVLGLFFGAASRGARGIAVLLVGSITAPLLIYYLFAELLGVYLPPAEWFG